MTLTHFIDVALHGDLREGFGLAGVMSSIHSINRRNKSISEPDTYPLGVAFPFWIDPKFHATRMIGFGSTGPIVRILASNDSDLHKLVADSNLTQLQSIGEISFSAIKEIPAAITAWTSFSRATDAEAKSPSHLRRLAKRATLRLENVSKIAAIASEQSKDDKLGFVKIPVSSASTSQSFGRAIRRSLLIAKPQTTKLDSWGFTKPGGGIPNF